jgi:triacylglycerol esterase/lipase EstA (alpha/beta hydrolase family)
MKRIRMAVLAVALIAAGAAGCTDPGGGGGGGGGGGRPTKIILVHGYTAEALPNWVVMNPGLLAAGFQTEVFRYPSNLVGAEAAARSLGDQVEQATRNGGKVGLLGHSEGGLITKTCIVLVAKCKDKVSHWFNISGVNNGTLISAGIPGTALGDMGTTSLLVNRLKANNATFRQQGIKCSVAWTSTDGLVYPASASQEPSLGCQSHNILGTTHFTIIMDARTVNYAVSLFRS